MYDKAMKYTINCIIIILFRRLIAIFALGNRITIMKNIARPFQKLSIQEVADNIEINNQLGSHIGMCGFFLCQEGWAEITLGENRYTIHKGDIYLYAPSGIVNILNRSYNLKGIAFKSSLDFIIPFIERIVCQKDIMMIQNTPCISLHEDQQLRIEELSEILDKRQSLLDEMSNTGPGPSILKHEIECLGEALFNELLFDYFDCQSVVPKKQDARDKVFQNFIISLMKNFKKEREVTFYAKEQCLTSRYFSSVVKEKTGHSALQWIVQVVISSAKQMLAHSDMSIKEIAIEFSFPTQSFFGKYFKQYVGVSPKEYRQNCKKD